MQIGKPICQLPNLPQPYTDKNTSNNGNLSTQTSSKKDIALASVEVPHLCNKKKGFIVFGEEFLRMWYLNPDFFKKCNVVIYMCF